MAPGSTLDGFQYNTLMVPVGRWRLYWWFERPEPSEELIPRSGPAAVTWMRRFRRRNDALPILRRLLAQHHTVNFWRWGDDGLLRQLADGVARGRLLVYEWRPVRGGGGTNREDTGPVLGPAFPLEERRGSAGRAEQSPDVSLVPNDAELVAIAAVLKAAAQDGVPFCEECAKAAAARGTQ
jgi:hypothetical protein